MSIISSCGSAPFEPPRVGYQATSGAAAAASSGPSVSNLSVCCPKSGALIHALEKMTSPRILVSDALRYASKTIPQNTPIMSKMIRFLSPKAPLGSSTVRMARILSFLSVKDVVKASSDLPADYDGYEIDAVLHYAKNLSPCNYFIEREPRCKVIDERVWIKCFGKKALDARKLSFDGLSVPEEGLGFLRKVNQFASVPLENNAGFTLLTIPEGLTLKKLAALAAAPQVGDKPVGFRYIFSFAESQHGEQLVKGESVAISNGVLLGSRNKSIAEQSALVAGHGCQMPRLLDAAALCFLTYINSSTTATGPVRLLNGGPWEYDPWTYTRCIETFSVRGKPINYIIGGFYRNSIIVDIDCRTPSSSKDSCVCVLRKF